MIILKKMCNLINSNIDPQLILSTASFFTY